MSRSVGSGAYRAMSSRISIIFCLVSVLTNGVAPSGSRLSVSEDNGKKETAGNVAPLAIEFVIAYLRG